MAETGDNFEDPEESAKYLHDNRLVTSADGKSMEKYEDGVLVRVINLGSGRSIGDDDDDAPQTLRTPELHERVPTPDKPPKPAKNPPPLTTKPDSPLSKWAKATK